MDDRKSHDSPPADPDDRAMAERWAGGNWTPVLHCFFRLHDAAVGYGLVQPQGHEVKSPSTV